ncbi:YadA-like family protein [Hafnia alvei]|uniref:YadA-like family protein n=1 Tax=Hafnia alvei TaxID=569 RepID=UPI0019375A7E|nr:YadA-like family protein [Hafnia alvei]QQE45182.1 YadA C-terminal domain-containing protein [Hafnia alvei]
MKTVVNKTLLAVVIASSLVSVAANASNADVISAVNALKDAKTDANNFSIASNAYQNLNARDRMVVDAVAEEEGVNGVLQDIRPHVNPANVPAGWKPELTKKSLMNVGKTAPVAVATAPVVHAAAPTNIPVGMDAATYRTAVSAQTDYDKIQNMNLSAVKTTATDALNDAAAAQTAAEQARKLAVTAGASGAFETAERKAADADLQTQIQTTVGNEANERQSADSVITNKLNSVKTEVAANAQNTADAHNAAIQAENLALQAKAIATVVGDEADQNKADIADVDHRLAVAGTMIDTNAQVSALQEKQIQKNINGLKDANTSIAVNTAKAEDAQNTARDAVVMGTANAQSIADNESRITSVSALAQSNQAKAEDAQNTARDAVVMGNANAQSIADNESNIAINKGTAQAALGAARSVSQQTNSRYQSMKVAQTPVVGASGADGQAGKDGADGVTTVITKHEVDTATQKAVASNTKNIDLMRGEVITHSHAAYSQATTDSKAYTNQKFSQLKSTVDDNRKEANAGTALAIAIASQPQVKTGDSFMVSAGAGTFNSESAVSVGASFNAGEHTVLKVGVSADTQSDFGAGVGVGFSY